MKKLLLPITALLLSTGINAQTYFSEDFSSGNLNDWTLTNADGDAFDWVIQDYTVGQGNVATSLSWDATAGALTPDNWMVSSVIDLAAATGTVNLEWKVKGQDQSFVAENYTVYVGTAADIATLGASATNFNEVLTTSTGYMSRTLDVSAFAGQSIFVAFRHHNVSDMFRMNVDDIKVRTPLANDMLVQSVTVDNTSDGDRTFTITCLNDGLNAVTAYDLDWTFDGGAATTINTTGVNIASGATHTLTVNVNGVTPGAIDFTANITTADDDMTNNNNTTAFTFVLPILPYTGTDTDGNVFDLYTQLEAGQSVLLDFMASWCGPCEASTPEISEWIQVNGSGNGKVQAIAITTESTDSDAVMSGLNWNGGFYHYPKFAYDAENNTQYNHYATMNASNGIPLFVLICPNVNDPGHSEIIQMGAGYGAGMFLTGAYNTALNGCASATYDVSGVEETVSKRINVSIFPNPAVDNANINLVLIENSNVSINMINALGQTVYTTEMNNVNGAQNVQVNTSNLETGMYFVNVTINGNTTTERINVTK